MANQALPGTTMQSQTAAYDVQRAAFQATATRGARWFYWIAGLSIINSVLILSGSNTRFAVGLGVTTILDAMGREVGGAGSGVTMAISLLIAGLFAVFGVFASKMQVWSFAVGMFLYVLDGLLLFRFEDFLSVAFHGLALYFLFRGLVAARSALALKPANAPMG